MDVAEIIKQLGTLGPSLGAVVVVGSVCYFLIKLLKGLTVKYLQVFDEHLRVVHEMSNNIRSNNDTINKMIENVQANTVATQKMSDFLENVQCVKARTSPPKFS